MEQFVYAKTDIRSSYGLIQQYEVGIVIGSDVKTLTVTFVRNNITLNLNSELLVHFDPKTTGDLYPKKICNVCNRLLDSIMFPKNQNGKNNRPVRRPSCKDCRIVIDGKNMTPSEKRKMNKIKPNMKIWTCPICKKTTIPGLTSKVVCDHNHKTGHPRAWICDSCNTGLGRFKDSTELLKNAIDYLNEHK